MRGLYLLLLVTATYAGTYQVKHGDSSTITLAFDDRSMTILGFRIDNLGSGVCEAVLEDLGSLAKVSGAAKPRESRSFGVPVGRRVFKMRDATHLGDQTDFRTSCSTRAP